jgi:aminocarboxymuconate-semialdehyde decarboxylase
VQLHTCTRDGAAPDKLARSQGPRTRPAGVLTFDLHCHTLIPAVESLIANTPQKAAEPEIFLKTMGAASVAHNNAVMLPRVFPKLTQLEQRLADMDAMGVDVQVVSPSPTQYCYWAEKDLAQQIVRVQNEAMAELCAREPKRLVALGTVSLQYPDLACEQLQTAVRKLGLRGIQISTSVGARELSDPSFRPVWRLLEELGVLAFIHPFGSSLGPRTNAYYLVNTIGQPLETTLALSHLIFGGVLDHFPGLKIVAAHGGGYLPTYVGRSDHAYRVRPEAAVKSAKAPSEHLKRIWFDTVVYDPLALRHLIDRVGASQVVIGTDYPFDMGCYEVHELLQNTPGLSDAERAAILGNNAAALVGWSAEQPIEQKTP